MPPLAARVLPVLPVATDEGAAEAGGVCGPPCSQRDTTVGQSARVRLLTLACPCDHPALQKPAHMVRLSPRGNSCPKTPVSLLSFDHCRRFARVWAVIGRMAHSYLMHQYSKLASWRPKNWGLNTLSCDGLSVRGSVTGSGSQRSITTDRTLSADVEAQRMRTERPWEGIPAAAAAWLHQCPYAREPVVCCGKGARCWETVCSNKEKANFELMRGFVHFAHAAHSADS